MMKIIKTVIEGVLFLEPRLFHVFYDIGDIVYELSNTECEGVEAW